MTNRPLIDHRKAKTEAQALKLLERRLRDERERQAVEAGLSETIALRTSRGEQFRQSERGPRRVMDGLDRLLSKSGIDRQQFDAGNRYGRLYKLTMAGGLGSCLENVDRVSGGGSTGEAERSYRIKQEMERVRSEGLRSQIGLINICNGICGRDLSCWEYAGKNDRVAIRVETTLVIALDLLCGYWQIK